MTWFLFLGLFFYNLVAVSSVLICGVDLVLVRLKSITVVVLRFTSCVSSFLYGIFFRIACAKAAVHTMSVGRCFAILMSRPVGVVASSG